MLENVGIVFLLLNVKHTTTTQISILLAGFSSLNIMIVFLWCLSQICKNIQGGFKDFSSKIFKTNENVAKLWSPSSLKAILQQFCWENRRCLFIFLNFSCLRHIKATNHWQISLLDPARHILFHYFVSENKVLSQVFLLLVLNFPSAPSKFQLKFKPIKSSE